MSLSSEKMRCQVILEREVKMKIEELATADSRSVSNFINKILKDYIKENYNKAD